MDVCLLFSGLSSLVASAALFVIFAGLWTTGHPKPKRPEASVPHVQVEEAAPLEVDLAEIRRLEAPARRAVCSAAPKLSARLEEHYPAGTA